MLLYFIFFTFSFFLQAQQDSISTKSSTNFYKNSIKDNYGYEIIPELKGFDDFILGLSAARTYYTRGRGIIDRKSVQVGLEYIPTKGIFAPKIKYWQSSFPLLIEGNIGASALYYFKKNKSSFAMRPEIGFGFFFIQFNYGYTFFINKNFEELNPHSFSLTFFYLIPQRDKTKK